MNKLWTFGCSYTEGFVDNGSPTYNNYKEYCGGQFPKSWPEILSEKLNIELINKGEGASGNTQIFQQICNQANSFGYNDIIVIGWTFLERYRLAKDDETWIKLGAGQVGNDCPISQECHEQIVLNRTLKPYVDEIYNYEKIIDRLCTSLNINVYYWTIINELIYNQPKEILNQKKYLLNDFVFDQYDNTFSIVKKNGGMSISEETNGLIDDSHMGKTGHIIQANLFYDHIIKYNSSWKNL
jgi:hypothetical protein